MNNTISTIFRVLCFCQYLLGTMRYSKILFLYLFFQISAIVI
ncbi:hypothetical protein CoNPh26_CDS0115 [Staphylococcus phage S-CoN_Ph26]|nr:hypothetical protein CoNPh26_CDS0115 [Staphylococcus phage S-CoN_Ph26]